MEILIKVLFCVAIAVTLGVIAGLQEAYEARQRKKTAQKITNNFFDLLAKEQAKRMIKEREERLKRIEKFIDKTKIR